MTTNMAKVVFAVGVSFFGAFGQTHDEIANTEMTAEVIKIGKKVTALHEKVNKISEKHESLLVMENNFNTHKRDVKARMESMESKYMELFTCLNVENGNTVVLKEGCHLFVKKGNHKVEGQLNVLGTHVINGGNLHIHDGTGSHHCSYGSSSTHKTKCNGLGNLIIGHSPESSRIHHQKLSGSHNIVVGSGHSISSHGAIVSGVGHTLLGAHASAIGGTKNTAAGKGSAVLGGSSNLAGSILGNVDHRNWLGQDTGSYATVTGGYENSASGKRSSVSGGCGNKANGERSSVSGGFNNTASGLSSSVLGGEGIDAIGQSWSLLGTNNYTKTSKGIKGRSTKKRSGKSEKALKKHKKHSKPPQRQSML